jgi:methylenetetrahydrofolate reductase (NADPH)
MKIIEHLQKSKSTLFSFELLPPLKGKSIQSIFDAIDPLMEFNPPFIDVTYHREEYVYKQHENGLLEKYAQRKRPGTVGICSAIMNRYKVDAVPHIICGGFSKEETENALIDLNFLGIDNVLILRGDAIKSDSAFSPHPSGHAHASDLLGQVRNMNQGLYLDQDLKDNIATNFCIGVAGYPEKHFESPNLTTDLAYLKKKVDLGAEFIVTQMFFENQAYSDFVEKCRAIGIHVPIIPGLKPITSSKQLTILPKIFHIDLPEQLSEAVLNAKDEKEVKQVGIEWLIEQSKGLMKLGVPVLHYYTMGSAEPTYQIAKAVF